MTSADPTQDIWSRLRAFCEHGHAWRYPPLTDNQARTLEMQFGVFLPLEERDRYMSIGNGFMERPQLTCYPPATEEQLRATEERLGFPLPPDLRRFYAEVANGGFDFDYCVLYGAIGGCGVNPRHRPNGPTIEELVRESDWRLHPRIEEALVRHPDRYVIVDSLPKDFLRIGDGGSSLIVINRLTGCLYVLDYWDELPDVIVEDPPYDPFHLQVQYMQALAPSLSAWFSRWLDGVRDTWQSDPQPLAADMVDTDDVPDPDGVWQGVYRFGPAWHVWEQPPDEEEHADNADVAIYMTYEGLGYTVTGVYPESPVDDAQDDWFVDAP